MTRTVSCCAPIVVFAFCFDVALADGLIFQLPPDGTWVEYEGQTSAEFIPAGADASMLLQTADRIRVSCVGEVIRSNRPCRWIEIEATATLREQKELVGDHTLKILVPNEYLARGYDPFEHVILAFWNPKDSEKLGLPIEPGFNKLRYELDRFLPMFAPPLADRRILPSVTIKTAIGEFEKCDVITGKSAFDRPTLDKGRWEFESEWTIALHPKAPFGVVRVEVESKGVEINSAGRHRVNRSNRVLVLHGSGRNATSRLVMDTGPTRR